MYGDPDPGRVFVLSYNIDQRSSILLDVMFIYTHTHGGIALSNGDWFVIGTMTAVCTLNVYPYGIAHFFSK